MARFRDLFCGVIIGFAAAHFVNKTPVGRRFFGRVNKAVDELVDAVVNGYREAEENRD